MTDRWDRWFMGLARYVATASKDPSTTVGAVIVGADDRRKIAFGYNGFPPGVADTPERLSDRKVKYELTIHAERNALDNATFDTRGATMYCTSHPCLKCSCAVVSKGIKRIVCPPLPIIEEGRWTEELPMAQRILHEAGVLVTIIGNRVVEDASYTRG
jgi:dCMP deaminase